MDAVINDVACPQCGQLFRPSRSREQRFCTPECRKSFHNANRSPPQASQPASQETQETVETPNETPAESTAEGSEEFDWNGESVVVQQQAAVAAYFNVAGAIVIRRKADCPRCDEDTWIIVEPENLPALITALQRLHAEED
jgi:hypothetical protein